MLMMIIWRSILLRKKKGQNKKRNIYKEIAYKIKLKKINMNYQLN